MNDRIAFSSTSRAQRLVSSKRKKKRKSRAVFWVFLFAAAFLAFGWWLWQGLNAPSHRFNYLLLQVDREIHKVLPGEEILLSPSQKVKIEEISTSVPFNIGVRIAARGIDVPALKYNQREISSLLPDQEIFQKYSFRVKVKYRDKELGYTLWKVRPFLEDWLARVNRIIDKEQRLDFLEKAVKVMPEQEELKRRLIKEYKDLKRWEKAASMLEDMAQKRKDRTILTELLEIYTSMENQDKIISVLKRLLELEPGDLEFRQRLADLYERAGKYEFAVREYEEMLEYLDENKAFSVLTHLGYLCARLGREEKAIHYYLKAKDVDPKDPNIYYNLYALYKERGKKDKAMRNLAEALELKPGDVEGRIELAGSLIEENRLKEAQEYLQEALNKDPDSTEALLLMSHVLEKRGRREELKKTYRKIISQQPQNESVLYNLGSLEYEDGNLKESLQYFKQYLKLNPKDKDAHRLVFDIYRETGNKESAYEKSLRLVDLNPGDIELYRYIFEYLKERDGYKKMIPLMKKGLDAGAGEAELRKYLIIAYLETDKKDKAENQIEHFLKSKPKDVELWMKLARLRESRNDLEGALKAYKTVLSLRPDHEEAGEAYLRLRLKSVKGTDEQD